jgi:uncharacterized protein (TIGR04168 family)
MISGQDLKQPSMPLTIAVVGDVHGAWDEADELALKHLGVDLVLLVGDFGNESIEVVQAIATLEIPKAAIFGNHDAWYTATEWGRKKCPYDRQAEDRVQKQIDLLGAAHVGYSKLDFPTLELTVVGGRPFSWGGSTWKNEAFYQERYGISNFEESIDRIATAAQQAAYKTVIFIGHCGPTGLGNQAEDPCGRDWQPIGGDYGDPDLAAAIAQIRHLDKCIPLVAFGHMHHQLRHTQARLRKMVEIGEEGTLYLNAASVPRIVDTAQGERLRNFSLVTLKNGIVTQATLTWVDQDFEVRSQQILYQQIMAQLSPIF